MHILPQLRKLEDKYGDWLVVVGVHCSKFPSEKETENVRNAVLRYGIEHPVINDRDFSLWQQYGVRSWPSLMFVDPAGKVMGKHEGEFEFEAFDRLLGDMYSEFTAAGLLDEAPLAFQLEAQRVSDRPLNFPGEIEFDPATDRIFVADSNHNRIVVTSRSGLVETVIGTGAPGSADGSFVDATFLQPQGMAVDGDHLYIADAGNHLIRAANMATGTVETIAGTGEQALFRHKGGDPFSLPLNSPYDLACDKGTLYIAMAGFHQLWAIDLETGATRPHAGDGAEAIEDGPLLQAKLAQPYGMATDGNLICFIDSESSALRTAPLVGTDPAEAVVTTLAGTGLFDFGDAEGGFDETVLQHPQGVAIDGNTVYVADTYNNKIKAFDLNSKMVTTVAGRGDSGFLDGSALDSEFNEPAGLAMGRGVLYIADTNNHAVRMLDIRFGMVGTLELTGL
jgi:DNA-binding beta-propeller fold protein YncE